MSNNFQKTTSNFFVTLLIGLIVVSFMFTGYESMKGSPNAVAKVGPFPITAQEYQREYSRQINFYKNAIMGGKDLTSQDIERFKIKDSAIKNLVQSKLQLIFSNKAGVYASPAEIIKTIKNFDFFMTNGTFDKEKYKLLLRNNGFTPKDFEKDIAHQVHAQNSQIILNKFPVSDAYIQEIGRFKEMRYNAHVVEITEKELKKDIKVNNKEIKEYLKVEVNKARTENLFKERKSQFDIPEKVKASHILIRAVAGEEKKAKKKIDEIAKKVNVKNFKKLANKYTEDPTGKSNGGSLGSFSRGKMVPEFERVAFTLRPGSISDPVKTNYGYHLIYVEEKLPAKPAEYEKFESKLATELIRDTKKEELKKLLAEVSNNVAKAIKSNNPKKVKKLQNKYNFSYDENIIFNRFEGSLGKILIDSKQTKEIFSALKEKDSGFFNFPLPGKNQIISIQKSFDKDLPVFDTQKEKDNLQRVLSDKVRQLVFKKMGDEVAVKQFVEL